MADSLHSGPVTTADTGPAGDDVDAPAAGIEVTESRTARVGSVTVRRALPRRARRSIGAWCFVDHMGPMAVTADGGIDIGPHPHMGLQTVTWLLAGEVLHRDSLGSEQAIRPGQLNLMTAGEGVSHAEEGTGRDTGALHGVQLWVAQPERTRHGEPAFEHHAALPRVEIGRATATVIVGALEGAVSPARRDSDHLGLDLDLGAGETALPLQPGCEHGLVVLAGAVEVQGQIVEPGHLAYLGPGRDECRLAVREPTRALLIGGVPLEEPLLMWWNFVARTRDEVGAAYRQWTADDGRFGRVRSSLPRVPTGPPPWMVDGPRL